METSRLRLKPLAAAHLCVWGRTDGAHLRYGLISTVSLARLTRLKLLWFHLEVGETNFNHPEYDFSVLIT